MNKKILQAAGLILTGMVLMGIIVWFTMPSLMLIKTESPHSYEKTLEVLELAISEEGKWRVTQTFDFQKNINDAGLRAADRLGTLALCHPKYASLILENPKDRMVTAMMPMGIGVYEDDKGQVYVSELNVGLMGKMFGGTISTVMSDAGQDINKLIDAVTMESK